MALLKKIKNCRAFVAVETIISMSVFLLVLIFVILLCSYQIPKMGLENETQTLAETAKMQGGLTDSNSTGTTNNDIDNFLNSLQKKGFDKNKVQISLKTINSKTNAIGVAPIGSTSSSYIKRSSLDPMVLTVTIQPKIKKILFYETQDYTFSEKFISERN